MAIHFDRFAYEGNSFVKELSIKLGHEGEIARTGILMRAVLHTLRDCITIPESFNLIAQLPMFLKGLYVENWKYNDKQLVRLKVKNLEDFADNVEKEQSVFGESRFNWDQSTIELTKIVLGCLSRYISKGEMEDIVSQLPLSVKEIFSEQVSIEM